MFYIFFKIFQNFINFSKFILFCNCGCFAYMYVCLVCVCYSFRDQKRALDSSCCGYVLASNLQMFLFWKCSSYKIFYRKVQKGKIQVLTIQFHFVSVHIWHTWFTGWKWRNPLQGIWVIGESLTTHQNLCLYFGEGSPQLCERAHNLGLLSQWWSSPLFLLAAT